MSADTLYLCDGTNLSDLRDQDGRPRGIDSVTGKRGTYHGDVGGGRLIDHHGETIREIVPPAATTTAMPAGERNTKQGGAKGRIEREDGRRWRTLNTFVDVVGRYLSHAEKAVWLVLFRDCRGGTVEASQRNLSARSGVAERSVVRAMSFFRDVRLLEVVKKSASKGEASLYRLEASPERCLDAIIAAGRTGDTVAPDEGGQQEPEASTNRCHHVTGEQNEPVPKRARNRCHHGTISRKQKGDRPPPCRDGGRTPGENASPGSAVAALATTDQENSR